VNNYLYLGSVNTMSMKNKNLIIIASFLAVVICLIITALLFYVITSTFLVIISLTIVVVTIVCVWLLVRNIIKSFNNDRQRE